MRKGFTLIEVIVVILIIVILVGLLAPAVYQARKISQSQIQFKPGTTLTHRQFNHRGVYLGYDRDKDCYQMRIKTDNGLTTECWKSVEIREYTNEQ